MSRNKVKRSATIVGLFLSLFGISLIGYVFKANMIFPDSYAKQILLSDFKKWILVLLIVLIIIFWEKRDFNSVGIKNIDLKTIIQSFLLAVGAVILSLLSLGIFINLLGIEAPSALNQISSLPLLLKLFTITTASVTEEFLYRGYTIERIYDLTGSLKLGGIIAAFIFLAIHFPVWRIAGAIPQVIFAILLTIFYLAKRNLIACIIMHWFINFIMIIILPSFI